MANADNPNGFTPVRHLSGGTIRMNEYPIVTDYDTAIFSGDVVTLATTGYVQVGAAASTNLLGVFAGCQYTDEAGNIVFSKYWPASQATLGNADAIAYVYDDPKIVYKAQTVTGTAAALAMVGALWDLTATAGSTTNGRSKQEVNIGASSTDNFKLIGLVKEADNAWGEHANVEVLINEHALNVAAGAEV